MYSLTATVNQLFHMAKAKIFIHTKNKMVLTRKIFLVFEDVRYVGLQ